MRRLRHMLVPFLAGLMIIGMIGTTSTASARPLATGITVPDAALVGQLGYDRIREAGASYTRITGRWSLTAPDTRPADWDPTDPADPNYDWLSIDHQVVNAVNAGLIPLMQIDQAPRWAERCNAPDEPGRCNPNPNDFAQFTAAAVKRYSGNFNGLPRVRFWQPWNEPNLHIFFKPQKRGNQKVSPGLYRVLLNRFANVVKSEDPTNLIVGGGLAPLGGTSSVGPLDFTRRLLCMQGRVNPKPIRGCGATARFDIWSINPYTTGGPTQSSRSPDDVQLGDVGKMVRLIRAAGRAGKIKSARPYIPVWVTEFSWDSKPPDPNGLPMRILNRWAAEAMFRSWRAGVDNFFWLSLRDWARIPGHPFNASIESGLWFRGNTLEQDRPKQVLRAFRFPFVSFRGRRAPRIQFWGRTPTSKAGNVVIRFGHGRGNVNRRIRVVRANQAGIFQGFIRTNLGRNQRGFLTATFAGETSLPFSLTPQRNFRQKPFG